MILDTIRHADQYTSVHPLLEKAFAYLKDCGDTLPTPGSYDLEGDALVAKVQTYDSNASGKTEAHNRYIDLQYIVSGTEKMYYAPRESLHELVPYDAEKDVVFLADSSEMTEITVHAGEFAIFYPHDAHKPGMQRGHGAEKIEKIVIKILV